MGFSDVLGLSGMDTIISTIQKPLSYLIIGIFLVFAIMFAIKAVINYVTSLSKESAQEKQTYKEAAKNNLIGLAISCVGFLIIQIILRMFGITLLG